MATGAGEVAGAAFNTYMNFISDALDRSDKASARAHKESAINSAKAQANSSYDEMMRLLNNYNDSRIKLADDNMVQEYKDIIGNYQPQVHDFNEFEYTKTVDDFLNPEAEKIANLAGLKTQAQLAGQGGAKGSGALAGMGYSRWDAADQLYKDAQQALKDDRAQTYTEYNDYIQNMQKKLDTLNQGTLDKAKLLGGAVENEQGAQGDYMSDLLGILGDKTTTNINATVSAVS